MCHKDSDCNFGKCADCNTAVFTALTYSSPQMSIFILYLRHLQFSQNMVKFFKMWKMINNENLYIFFCIEFYIHITANGN